MSFGSFFAPLDSSVPVRRSGLFIPAVSKSLNSDSAPRTQIGHMTFEDKCSSVFKTPLEATIVPTSGDADRSDELIARMISDTPEALVLYASTGLQHYFDLFLKQGPGAISDFWFEQFYAGNKKVLLDMALFIGAKRILCCAMTDFEESEVRGELMFANPVLAELLDYLEATIGKMPYEETSTGNFFGFLLDHRGKTLSEVLDLLGSSTSDDGLVLQQALIDLFTLRQRASYFAARIEELLPDWYSQKVLIQVPVLMLEPLLVKLYKETGGDLSP